MSCGRSWLTPTGSIGPWASLASDFSRIPTRARKAISRPRRAFWGCDGPTRSSRSTGWRAAIPTSYVCLKIGVHQGPAIAINNESKFDYFGTTINMAARVQQKAQGRDVVFTEAVRQDPDVDAYLKAANWRCQVLTVSLKGIEGTQTLYQVYPVPGGRE